MGGEESRVYSAATAVNNLTLNVTGLSFNYTAGAYTVNGAITLSAGLLTQSGETGHLKFGMSANNTLSNVQIAADALDFSTTSGSRTGWNSAGRIRGT